MQHLIKNTDNLDKLKLMIDEHIKKRERSNERKWHLNKITYFLIKTFKNNIFTIISNFYFTHAF